jgi:hypothetical protein
MAFIDVDNDLWARTQMRRVLGKCRWCGAKGTIERETESDNPFLVCKSCDAAEGEDRKLALLQRYW